jgi:GntR family transcriptional regulator
MRRIDGAPQGTDPPVYLRIQQFLQEMVEGPDCSPGDKIPSERALAERLGASRMTVRKAIENLVGLGVLERDSTSGTRVAAPRVTRPINEGQSRSISQIVHSGGGKAGSKLLYFELSRASRKIAERLRVHLGAELVVIRRLRTVNDRPFCVETSLLPAHRVPGLAASDLSGDQSLYALLGERYDIELGTGDSLVSVAPATALEARFLDLQAGSPILLFRSLVFDKRGEPIEYLTSVNHPQLVAFRAMHSEVM